MTAGSDDHGSDERTRTRSGAGGLAGSLDRFRRLLGRRSLAETATPPPASPATASAEPVEHAYTQMLTTTGRPHSDLELVDSLVAYLNRQPEDADRVLRDLGTTFFPVENGWRSLFTRLIQQTDAQPELKRLALEDFRRYLARRASGGEAVGSSEEVPLPPSASGTLGKDIAQPPAPHLVRLPAGRPVVARSPDAMRPLEVRLASCRLWLRHGNDATLTLPDGSRVALEPGRTTIGRDPSVDIVISAEWPDVSRRHLLVDTTNGAGLVLTDVSSFGTFVARDALQDMD